MSTTGPVGFLLWGACALVGVYLLAPILMILLYSVNSVQFFSFPPPGLSLRWYGDAVAKGLFFGSILLSAQIAALSTLVALALGVPAALALVRGQFPGRKALATLFLAPSIFPAALLGVALLLFFSEVQRGLPLTLAPALPGLVLGHVVITLPWVIRSVSSSLTLVDRRIEEAAVSLGANPPRTFWEVTLPLVRPGLISGGVFAFIASFENLELSLFLTSSGLQTLPMDMLIYIQNYRNDPAVAAVSTMVVLGTALAIAATGRIVGLSRIV
jgi:putative spermidine/putrescine transport system permease protein